MIRIAHVTNQLEMGGMERLLVEFARHADRSRFALEFVCLGRHGPIGDVLESLGWPVRTLEMKPGLHPGAMLSLAREFRSARIDVVHTHNTKPLLYAAPASKIAGIAGLVHTRHGQRIGTSRRQDVAFAIACKAADRVVCVSDATRRAGLAEGVSESNLCTIENGIDLDRFPFSGPQPNGPAVFVGRLSPEKGVEVLLQAVKRVREQEPTFRLKIAGDGPDKAALCIHARTLGVDDCVEFLGGVPDVVPQLKAASMLVLPSRSEGLSIAVLEAMAVGLPVIATRVGGTPEAVIDGTTGVLVEHDDVDALAGAIVRLWRVRNVGVQLGRAGRKHVEARFDVRNMVSRYEMVYESVLDHKGALAA